MFRSLIRGKVKRPIIVPPEARVARQVLLQIRRHTTSRYTQTDESKFHLRFFVKLP